MDKRDFFIEALKSGAHKRRHWVLSAFSVITEKEGEHLDDPYPYRIIRKEDACYFINPDNEGEHELIEGATLKDPVFAFKEKVELPKGALENLNSKITTTYGRALFNKMVLVYGFHDKIPYQNKEIKAKAIEAMVEKRLVNEPESGTPTPGDENWEGGEQAPIYISEYKYFAEAMFALAGFTQLCVPAASPKSMVAHPDMKRVKAELMEKYKDRLDDPAVIAKIDEALVELDKEWLKDDPSDDFYISKGSREVKRKKMHYMQGAEMAFTDGSKASLVSKALSEGWDIDKMPELMNSLREGSYSRGKLTALGGEAVKYFMRVFQNTKVSMDDCGTTTGREKTITKDNMSRYVGFYEITGSETRLLDEDTLKSLVGKTIVVRSPMYCKAPKTDFCVKCVGNPNSENPKALGSAVASVGSEFMSIFMAAAHATQLKTESWSLDELK